MAEMLGCSPLYYIMKDGGAVFGSHLGQQVDLHYGDQHAEYTALRSGAGMVHLYPTTQVELSGPDRAAFFNRLCTNKIDEVPSGCGRETFLTDAKARILAHGFVFVGSDSIVLETAGGQAGRILGHLDYYLIREEVEIHDRSDQWSELLVAGRRSADVLRRWAGVQLPEEHLAHQEVELAEAPVSVRSIDQAWSGAFLVSCQTDQVVSLWQALRQAGAQPCGRLAAEALRIEAGWPEYGRDITEDNLPQEVARRD